MISQVHGEMVELLLVIIHGTRMILNLKITQMESRGSKFDRPFSVRVNPNYTYHLPIKGQVGHLSLNTQKSTYSNHLNSNSFMPFWPPN